MLTAHDLANVVVPPLSSGQDGLDIRGSAGVLGQERSDGVTGMGTGEQGLGLGGRGGTFIQPTAYRVLKTRILNDKDGSNPKLFINLTLSPHIPPAISPDTLDNAASGDDTAPFKLPMSITTLADTTCSKGSASKVVGVCVNEGMKGVLGEGRGSQRCRFVWELVLSWVETKFDVEISRDFRILDKKPSWGPVERHYIYGHKRPLITELGSSKGATTNTAKERSPKAGKDGPWLGMGKDSAAVRAEVIDAGHGTVVLLVPVKAHSPVRDHWDGTSVKWNLEAGALELTTSTGLSSPPHRGLETRYVPVSVDHDRSRLVGFEVRKAYYDRSRGLLCVVGWSGSGGGNGGGRLREGEGG